MRVHTTTKTIVQDQMDNDEKLIRQLDWANEMRGDVVIRMTSYHQRAITQYNKRARPRCFRPRTLVLRKIFENIAKIGVRKLQANWKGSYVVTKVGDSRAYHIQTRDDVPLLCPWNEPI